MSDYINCESEIKPQRIGFYSVYIQNVRTSLPQYLEFNGNEWVDLESVKEIFGSNRICWCEGEIPLETKPELPELF